MKRIVAACLAILLCSSSDLSAMGSRPEKLPELEKGISTWTYGFKPGISKKVKEFNESALPHLEFRYFFPYAGSVSFVVGPSLDDVFDPDNDLPEPHTITKLSSFQAPEDWNDRYFSRLRGFLHPPTTGEYTFWIASDDDGKLFLAKGIGDAEKRKIAEVEGWSGPGEWDKSPAQKSAPMVLKAEESYFIEAIHMEGGGADHLAIAWEGPGIERQVIAGKYLSPPSDPAGKGKLVRECWMSKDLPAKEGARFVTGYGRDNVRAYAASLPEGIMLLPIVDGRNPGGAFDNWSDEEYRKVAEKVAWGIIDDPDAAGVHIDVEPFRASHIPFYAHLRRILNRHGKLTSMFVGFANDKTMTEIFEACDIVVISGYDLGCDNSLECYRNGMTNALARIQKIAEKTKGHYLVGIPAAASWGEYEYTAGNDCRKKETGVKQEEYVRAATGLVCSYMNKPQCLGVSLWVMSDPETSVENSPDDKCREGSWRYVDGCCKHPALIRESVWRHLAGYCPPRDQ